MRLTHHCKDFEFDPNRRYDHDGLSMKPKGLWLSVDDDWGRWCRDDGMEHWVDDVPVHEFALLRPERILKLTTTDDLLTFSKHFAEGRDSYRLPWHTLTEHWAGILIAPYQWELRLDHRTDWYYTWDCASACIWDLSVVEQVGSRA